MGDGRKTQRAMQRAGQFRNVVDVGCFACDMQMSRLVRTADADAGAVVLRLGFGAFVDAGGRVLHIVGEGFCRLEQRGV